MLKKVISLAITTVVASSLFVMPAHAASFSEENWERYYNSVECPSGNFNGEVIEELEIDGGSINTHVKNVGSAKTSLTSNRNPIKYATWRSRGESPKYTHLRLYLGAYEDSDRTGLDALKIMQHVKEDGSASEAFTLRGTDGRAWPYGDYDNIIENYNTDLWSLRSSVTDEEFHKLDFIVDHTGLQNPTAITYLFIDDKYVGSHYNSSKKAEVGAAFYGFSFRILKNNNINTNTTLEAKFEEGMEGHVEYYDTDDYVVTLEDVMQHAGLGIETEDSTVIYKTDKLNWYMPGSDQARRMKYQKDGTKTYRSVNANVTEDGTASTVEFTTDDAESKKLAADLLTFYPYSVTDGRKGGITYTSYHPRAKYVHFSYDMTIEELGNQLYFDILSSGATEAFKMRNNGSDKLVVTLVDNGDDVVETVNTGVYDTNKIDWVLEFAEADSCVHQHMYVNKTYVGTSSFGSSSANRINNIQMSSKGDATVTFDNWTMTLYNHDIDFETLDAQIRGVKPTASVKWMEDECGIEYDEESGDFVVYAGATAKNYDVEAKIIVAIYGESGRLLEVDVKDFESGVVIGNEIEPTIFNTNSYDEAIGNVSVFVWDMANATSALNKLDLEF